MSKYSRSLLFVVFALCSLLGGRLRAQGNVTRGALAVVVRDTSGQPIRQAEVAVRPGNLRGATGPDGVVKFSAMNDGEYTVNVRRIGFFPQTRAVMLTRDGAIITISLLPAPQTLQAIVTASARGGLSGTVEDNTHLGLSNASVSVLASNRRAVTDSAGRFFVDVRAGRYMLKIERDGFQPRTVSVTVPRDSGRNVVVQMLAGSGEWSVAEKVALFDLNQRLIRTAGVMRIWTREDLQTFPIHEVQSVAEHALVRPVDDGCMATINGDDRYQESLWSIDFDQVEMMEVSRAVRPRLGALRGERASRDPLDNCPSIIVWLRR